MRMILLIQLILEKYFVKYLLVFNYDKKMIGFYTKNTDENSFISMDNSYIKIILIIFMVLLAIILVVILIKYLNKKSGRKIRKMNQMKIMIIASKIMMKIKIIKF